MTKITSVIIDKVKRNYKFELSTNLTLHLLVETEDGPALILVHDRSKDEVVAHVELTFNKTDETIANELTERLSQYN